MVNWADWAGSLFPGPNPGRPSPASAGATGRLNTRRVRVGPCQLVTVGHGGYPGPQPEYRANDPAHRDTARQVPGARRASHWRDQCPAGRPLALAVPVPVAAAAAQSRSRAA
jgi:hypothetical protein